MFKPYFGICLCGCGKPGLIVVKKGLIKPCNERLKKEAKTKRTARIITKIDKKVQIKDMVKRLDALFSFYIRLRHADSVGLVSCFTSGKIMHYTEAHAGHFISRRHYAVRWDEQNVQVQSYAENMHNQGNAPTFAKRLDEVYGEGTALKLIQKKNNKFKLETFVLKTLIATYTLKVAELKTKLKIK